MNEKEEYCIMFRAWPKLNYSRAGWSTEFFHFEDKDGKILGGSAHTSNFIASYGTKNFEWPEDSLLYIVAVDGEVIELDLTEYCDEKK